MKEKYLASFLDLLKNFKPSLTDNVPKYDFEIFKKDLFAGLTVAAILIPNTMGYAILAGLPPVMGLYAALPAVLVAALWGSSAYVITAPVGVVSLLAATSLSTFASPNTVEFITLAISLAILVGIIQFLLGFFRLGVLARLIPHSALIGFTNAAAILIALSQLPLILGITKGDMSIIQIFQKIFVGESSVHILSLIIGLATITFVLLGKKFLPRFPVSLIIVVASILIGEIVSMQSFGIKLIGYVPSGLPAFSFSAFSFPVFYTLIVQGFLIAMVGFVETYSISQALAKRKNEKVNADKELTGQGMANIFSGVFGGFPVSGSFSASALNFNSGAKTAVSGVIVAAVIFLALLLLGPFLSLIPKPVLGGIVIAAVLHLIDVKKFKEIYRLSKIDGIIAMVTAVIALIIKPDDALFIGIALGISFFVVKNMSLNITEVGLHKSHKSLWARDNYNTEELFLSGKKLMVRLDQSLIFSNADLLSTNIFEKINLHEKEFNQKVDGVLVNCGGLNYLDLSGIEALIELESNLKKAGIQLAYMLVKDIVLDDFKRAGLLTSVRYIHGNEELAEFCDFKI